MLSILIPTYNYNIVSLVNAVYNQVKKTEIPFQILCYDDNSTNSEIVKSNQEINLLENTTYTILKQNIGRSAIRNLLAKNAKYEWLLFLDADVLPKANNFITTYLQAISNNSEIIYGGILYQEEKPNPDQILRWVYGNKRESLTVAERNKNPYLSFLTLNFLIKKSIFNKVSFNEEIPNLRHEDTLFSYHLSLKKINISHIQNPVYHLGLENSKVFLKKSIESVDAILLFLEQELIAKDYTLITRVFYKLKKVNLHRVFAFIYRNFQKVFKKILLSKKPSLFVFDIYRLSYFCDIYIQKK